MSCIISQNGLCYYDGLIAFGFVLWSFWVWFMGYVAGKTDKIKRQK